MHSNDTKCPLRVSTGKQTKDNLNCTNKEKNKDNTQIFQDAPSPQSSENSNPNGIAATRNPQLEVLASAGLERVSSSARSISLPDALSVPRQGIPQLQTNRTTAAVPCSKVISPPDVLRQTGAANVSGAATSVSTTNWNPDGANSNSQSIVLSPQNTNKICPNVSKAAIVSAYHNTSNGNAVQTSNAPIRAVSKLTTQLAKALTSTSQSLIQCTSISGSRGPQSESMAKPVDNYQSFREENYESQTDSSEMSQSILKPITLYRLPIHRTASSQTTVNNANINRTAPVRLGLSNGDNASRSKLEITHAQGNQTTRKIKPATSNIYGEPRNAINFLSTPPISYPGVHVST